MAKPRIGAPWQADLDAAAEREAGLRAQVEALAGALHGFCAFFAADGRIAWPHRLAAEADHFAARVRRLVAKADTALALTDADALALADAREAVIEAALALTANRDDRAEGDLFAALVEACRKVRR